MTLSSVPAHPRSCPPLHSPQATAWRATGAPAAHTARPPTAPVVVLVVVLVEVVVDIAFFYPVEGGRFTSVSPTC